MKLLQDLRFGLRQMGRTPIVTLTAVLSLSLALATSAAAFSILNAFLIELFPYEDQDELVMFRTLPRGMDLDMAGGVSAPNFSDYK